MYSDRVVITGELKSYQGNEVGRRNWLKKLNENKYKVVVQLVSQNPEMKESLERLIDLETVSIEFPWRDIPEQPKCNGTFNREKGEIEHHTNEEECPIHKVPTHTHEDPYPAVKQFPPQNAKWESESQLGLKQECIYSDEHECDFKYDVDEDDWVCVAPDSDGKQIMQRALTDIDYLLKEGFDTNVDDCDMDGVRETIKELKDQLEDN